MSEFQMNRGKEPERRQPERTLEDHLRILSDALPEPLIEAARAVMELDKMVLGQVKQLRASILESLSHPVLSPLLKGMDERRLQSIVETEAYSIQRALSRAGDIGRSLEAKETIFEKLRDAVPISGNIYKALEFLENRILGKDINRTIQARNFLHAAITAKARGNFTIDEIAKAYRGG